MKRTLWPTELHRHGAWIFNEISCGDWRGIAVPTRVDGLQRPMSLPKAPLYDILPLMRRRNKVAQLAAQRRFYRNHPGYHYTRNNARRVLRAKFINEQKQGKCCAKCGESHIACLDFHHPGEKDGMLSGAARSWSVKHILAEIKKCVILCSNCHRKLHWNEKRLGRPAGADPAFPV